MKIPKPSDDDRARFHALVPDDPRVEVKPMFGNLGAYVNGNLFMGSFGADIGLKLATDDQLALVGEGGGDFGPVERPMSGYVTLPDAWNHSPARCEPWVATALAYVGSLPPKVAKPRKPTKRAAPKG